MDRPEISKIINTKEGRDLLTALREDYYDVDSFDVDPLEMARIGGQRELVRDLLDMVEED